MASTWLSSTSTYKIISLYYKFKLYFKKKFPELLSSSLLVRWLKLSVAIILNSTFGGKELKDSLLILRNTWNIQEVGSLSHFPTLFLQ